MDYYPWENIPSVAKRKCKTDNENRITYIKIVYILAIVLWFFLIFFLKLYLTSWLGWLLILIPIVCFLIGYYNASVITTDVEDEIFRANYLSIGLIIIIPLLVWLDKKYEGDHIWFVSIVVVAIMLSTLSFLDVWVQRQWLSVIKHITSTFQTMSIVLITFVLFTFFMSDSVGFKGC